MAVQLSERTQRVLRKPFMEWEARIQERQEALELIGELVALANVARRGRRFHD